MSNLRDELVQVAAVAVAILTDMDAGTTTLNDGTTLWTEAHLRAWQDVEQERLRQELKWGPQHHPIAEWLVILGEEYGEACQAALDTVIFPKPCKHANVEYARDVCADCGANLDSEEAARDGSNNYYGPEDFGYPSTE